MRAPKSIAGALVSSCVRLRTWYESTAFCVDASATNSHMVAAFVRIVSPYVALRFGKISAARPSNYWMLLSPTRPQTRPVPAAAHQVCWSETRWAPD
jgi:hypothetical protein